LETRFRKKQYKKRALGSVNFELKKGTEIAIKLFVLCFCMPCCPLSDFEPFSYSMMMMTKPESGPFLDSKTNNQLTCVTKWVCADTGQLLCFFFVPFTPNC
jgi:hypothetical protein